MAFTKTALTSTAWTLIGNNVSLITFQNTGGSWPILINITTSNTPPVETAGLLYDVWYGESKRDPATMSISSGTYVWARSTSKAGFVTVET